MSATDKQLRSVHNTAKKKARFAAKVKPLLHRSKKQVLDCCSMQAHQLPTRAKLEGSAMASTQGEFGSRAKTTRRQSQHRRNLVESRPRQLLVADPSPAVFRRVQPEAHDSRMHKRKRRDGRSLHLLPSNSGSDLNSCRFDEGVPRYNVEYSADAPSTSTLSFCSRLGAEGYDFGTAGSMSGCVDTRSHFEHLSSRNARPSRPSELRLSSCFPFSVPELYQLDASDAAAAGFHDTNQCQQISLILESSPESHEQLCNKRLVTKRSSTKSSDLISPLIDVLSVNVNGARTLAADLQHLSSASVAAISASSTSSTLVSQERSKFHRKSCRAALSGGPDMINSIPSSPTLMFKQVLKNPSWGLTPLIEAETSKCEKFHFANSEEDFDHLLDKLHERELDLPLLWGYLERSHTTGIYEPHRYFIVVWQIQHASKYKYQLDTLFRAVSLLDRCLRFGTMVTRQTLWLLGVACMCIAAKLETQFSSIISFMEDVCTETGQKPCFTKKQLVWMETVVLHVVNYECLTPTAATFIWHFLWDFRKDREVQTLAFSILCLSLTDYEALRFPASVISASAVFLTCIILNRVPPLLVMKLHWTKPAARSCVKVIFRGTLHCCKRLQSLVNGAG